MGICTAALENLPYLSAGFLDQLNISPSDVVNEIERQIIGQSQGKVWCAPEAAVLPGDDRYIAAPLGVGEAKSTQDHTGDSSAASII